MSNLRTVVTFATLVVSCVALGYSYEANQELNATQRQLDAYSRILNEESGTAPMLGDTTESRGIFSHNRLFSRELGLGDCCPGVTVTHLTVPAGGTVWETVKDQFAGYYYQIGQYVSDQELEALTKTAVDDLQTQVTANRTLKIQDLGKVPAGYQIDWNNNFQVSPVLGQ